MDAENTSETRNITAKMETLVLKWKDRKEPTRGSNEWFERKVDRLRYVSYRNRLQELKNKPDIYAAAQQMFGDLTSRVK